MSGIAGNRSGTVTRLCVIAAAGILLGACKDSGLPDKNKPLAEAMEAEWRYPAYEKTPGAGRVLSLEGQSFQMSGSTENVPEKMLKTVATVDGAPVYSLKSDEAPYDRLFTASAEGGYSVVLPVR